MRTQTEALKLALHFISRLKFADAEPEPERVMAIIKKALERFAILVAKQQREEDAKLVESMTLEWPDQPEFAQVERTTIQDCALIIRQRVVTYD